MLPPQAPFLPGATPWARVQRALKEALASPPGVPLHRAYEAFSTDELRRAVTQGMEEARTVYHYRPQVESDQKALENVRVALDFYPMVARTEGDLTIFFEQIENQDLDPVYREFLIRRLVPGLAPRSLFGDYLQTGVARHLAELDSRLGRLAYLPTDIAAVQLASMEAYLRLHQTALLELLRRDASLASYFPGDATPAPAILQEQAVQSAARRVLRQKERDFNNTAKIIGRHLEPGSTSPDLVREKARQLIQEMLDESLVKPGDFQGLLAEADASPGSAGTAP